MFAQSACAASARLVVVALSLDFRYHHSHVRPISWCTRRARNRAIGLRSRRRHHGYRIAEKITVVERRDLLASHEDVGLSNEIRVTQLPPKPSAQDSHADWLLTELRRTGRLRKSQVIQRTGWSDSTARRTLAKLRENGQIVFEGSARSGYWRAA